MLAFIVTSMPNRFLNSALTASPSSFSLNMTAIEAIPSPRSAMNSDHRFGPSSRLEQLEVHLADVDLGAAQGVVDWCAAQLRRVVHRQLVVKDVPRSPAEGPVIGLHRSFEVAHGQRDLGDRKPEARHSGRQLRRLNAHRSGTLLAPQDSVEPVPDFAVVTSPAAAVRAVTRRQRERSSNRDADDRQCSRSVNTVHRRTLGCQAGIARMRARRPARDRVADQMTRTMVGVVGLTIGCGAVYECFRVHAE